MIMACKMLKVMMSPTVMLENIEFLASSDLNFV